MNRWQKLWVNRQCEHCEEELFEEDLFCGVCRKEIDRFLYPVVSKSRGYSLMSIYHYDGIIRDLLRRMKFHEGRYLSRFFAGDIARFLNENDIHPEVVAHIPMHRKKKRKRGFDQAEDLSVETAKLLGVSSAPLLCRKKQTKALYALNAKERMRELEEAFSVLLPGDERLWVVLDDIVTSGSTIDEAALTLKEANILNALFLVIAR